MDEETAHDRSPELGSEEDAKTTTTTRPNLQEGEEEVVEDVGASTVVTPFNLSPYALDKSTQKLARELSRPFIVQWYVLLQLQALALSKGRTALGTNKKGFLLAGCTTHTKRQRGRPWGGPRCSRTTSTSAHRRATFPPTMQHLAGSSRYTLSPRHLGP